jgi:predicted enzyme related to lactoylglutathione lyase
VGTSTPVVHFLIGGNDAVRLAGFYEGIFDWKVDPEGGAVDGHDKDDGFGISGNIVPTRHEPFVAVYVRVADPEATLEEIVRRGGKVLRGVKDTPGQATTALFADPEGNVIGLVKA